MLCIGRSGTVTSPGAARIQLKGRALDDLAVTAGAGQVIVVGTVARSLDIGNESVRRPTYFQDAARAPFSAWD